MKDRQKRAIKIEQKKIPEDKQKQLVQRLKGQLNKVMKQNKVLKKENQYLKITIDKNFERLKDLAEHLSLEELMELDYGEEETEIPEEFSDTETSQR